jgi:hypothetical protein
MGLADLRVNADVLQGCNDLPLKIHVEAPTSDVPED